MLCGLLRGGGCEGHTRDDGSEFLAIAAAIPIEVTTQAYPLDRADDALADLAAGRVRGAAVLHVDSR